MIFNLFGLSSDCLETPPAPRVRRKLVRVCWSTHRLINRMTTQARQPRAFFFVAPVC